MGNMSQSSKKEKPKEKPLSEDKYDSIQGSKPLTSDELYLKGEFMAMDWDRDGMLTTTEFLKLIQFLGYADVNAANKLLKKINKDHNSFITIDEYFDAMKNNEGVMWGTRRLREMFHSFDKTSDGAAKREDVYRGYEEMGIKVDQEIRDAIDKLDLNKDGMVQYVDFVSAELRRKKII